MAEEKKTNAIVPPSYDTSSILPYNEKKDIDGDDHQHTVEVVDAQEAHLQDVIALEKRIQDGTAETEVCCFRLDWITCYIDEFAICRIMKSETTTMLRLKFCPHMTIRPCLWSHSDRFSSVSGSRALELSLRNYTTSNRKH